MGWLILTLLVALSLAGLWLLRVRGGLLTACAAALCLGAAGYALQGRPNLSGFTAPAGEAPDAVPLTEVRHAFYGNFSAEESWLLLSEGLARSGNSEDAVGILQNAVQRYPGSAELWVGLGNALVNHSHGLTPPADYAFTRAAELAPGHPGPRFFRDLALLRSGDANTALGDLMLLLKENPKASWRPMVGKLVLAIIADGGRQEGSGRAG